jgi:microcystin-dependent protein
MSEPFLAEVKVFGFNFAPRGFATCDGQVLPINQNQSLYSLLGTSFGGDGRTTFALPDLRGRVPVHTDEQPGAIGGAESSQTTTSNMPAHNHQMNGTSNSANSSFPGGGALGTPQGRRPVAPYGSGSERTQMRPTSPAGSSIGIHNMQPYLVVNFCIALQGVFPPRN